MFSQQTLDFLFENRLQNSREWFEAHREDYRQYVLAPLAALVSALTPTMRDIDPSLICEPKVDKSISRIYRDTRFSKDKSLYRDTAWAVFIRDKRLYEGLPGYFFEITPAGWRYGCGYYQTSPDSMGSIREMALKNDPDFQAALAAYEGAQGIFEMEGELYKRSKYPDQPEKLRNWLDRKGIGFIRNSVDFGLLFSDGLAPMLAGHYQRLAPIYNFFIKAEGRRAISSTIGNH
ncbi:MAG: DUF2461 domain-containing protein [Defluviitaleaceae bacterium]|nr:DUF2461 domain-containing protein [Defluviitaleaceae bacterium]